jgi:hypothetical protein
MLLSNKPFYFVISFIILASNLRAQSSVNVYGNSVNNYLQTSIQPSDSAYIAFGTTIQLGIQHFDFKKGNDWQMYFYEKPNQTSITIYGTGGVMDNDSTFVVLGRVGKTNTAVIKATQSGRIVWSYWYSTGLDEYPDKIIKLSNGDFLVSTRTNVDYNEFGEWGSHAAIFRINNDGKLLWSRLLDYRSANTSSFILGMYETPSHALIITQAYNSNLGLFKLTAKGDSIKSLISSQGFVGAGSDYNPNLNRLFVVSPDKKLLCFDSSLNLLWHKAITNSSLSSLSLVKSISDSTLCLGGKYSNDACLLYTDTQATVIKGYSKRFLPSSPSTLSGFYKVNQELFSMFTQGYAITQHNPDISNPCFNNINGSLFNTTNNSQISFKSHIKIQGNATWDEWKDIIAIRSKVIDPSANCKSIDIGVQPEKNNYNFSCRNKSIKVYISNHGTTTVTKLSYRIYADGMTYDSTITIIPLGSKSGAFYVLKTLYLKAGSTVVTGRILKVNDKNDEFNLNDSFTITITTKGFQNLKLTSKDTFCEGKIGIINSFGKSGVYQWYKNNIMLKQGTENYFISNSSGSYHAIYTDSGCIVYSDTILLKFISAPIKPIISKSGGKLMTDANNPFYWVYNSQKIDSNVMEILPKYNGLYKVVARNQWGCETESDPFNFSAGLYTPIESSALFLFANNEIQWIGLVPTYIWLYTVQGQIVQNQILEPKQKISDLRPGIYFLQFRDSIGNLGYKKVCIRE